MRYIFIYYNIIYLILLILIFIYIKKVLNNCYNIETFEETSNTLSTEKNNKRNRNILIKKNNDKTNRYNVVPENKTNVDDIPVYNSEYNDIEKLLSENLVNDLTTKNKSE